MGGEGAVAAAATSTATDADATAADAAGAASRARELPPVEDDLELKRWVVQSSHKRVAL